MAGVIIPVGYGLAVFHFQQVSLTEEAVVTLGFTVPGSGTPDARAASINAAWSDASTKPFHQANISNVWRYLGVTTTEQTATGPVQGSASVNIVGTLNIAPPPPNVAMLLRKATNRGGRKGRGRWYMPPLGLQTTDIGPNGAIIAGTVTTQQTRYTAALVSQTSSGPTPQLLHSAAAAVAPDTIVALQVQGIIATQRRRVR